VIRALIVDDEPLVRERIRTLLAGHADVEVVGELGDGLSALAALGKTSPDVVFLDIHMPGLSGLEVAEGWRREAVLPIVIFVTAYDQFALEAFRLHALDYLTKPIDPERLADALGRAREQLRRGERDEVDQRLRAVLEQLDRRVAVRPHLVVKEDDRYVLVQTAEIHGIEATGNYVCLHCERSSHLLRSTLGALEARLDPQRFVRVHRSWIVNVEKVREAQPWSKGSWALLTRSGLKIPVGPQYHDALARILK
jgi:two-component system LytT family response regulator